MVLELSKQFNELAITVSLNSIRRLKNIFTKIPEDIEVLIPGNHDAVRLSDPQPSIPEVFTKPLF